LDYRRQSRTGTPEIILAEHKSDAQVIDLVHKMLDRNGTVLVSRASRSLLDAIANDFRESVVEHPEGSSMVRVATTDRPARVVQARIAVFTAGTSDLPRAQEVRLVAEEMGVQVQIWADVGVAGLHRIINPFRQAIDWGVSTIVVVAGMDGALPSVVAGLSSVPVIGLPVSVGYGFGGGGEAALMAMLQTCAPGLTVVNIDNSVGAGIAAARIALQSEVRS
ncbi:MAG: nickel pincer cofactor biosynthesis protein LarB, partial [Thermomicrobiaceae bacterium]